MAPRSICAHRADSRNSTHHLEYNPGASPMQIMLQNKSGSPSHMCVCVCLYMCLMEGVRLQIASIVLSQRHIFVDIGVLLCIVYIYVCLCIFAYLCHM